MDDEDINLEKYGEFVCSYHAWIGLEQQKEQAKRMEKMTNNKQTKK